MPTVSMWTSDAWYAAVVAHSFKPISDSWGNVAREYSGEPGHKRHANTGNLGANGS